MEEDVLGPREELVGDRYTRCSKCGTMTPIDKANLIAVDGALAAQLEELCQQCREDLDSGDAVWPVAGSVDEESIS